MKDRRKQPDVVSWSRFFWCTLFVVFSCVTFTFSTFHLFPRGTFELGTRRVMEAINDGESPLSTAVSIRETVMLPDQVLIFLKYPPPARLFTKDDLSCVYTSVNSSQPHPLKQPPIQINSEDLNNQIVRCSIPTRGVKLSLDFKSEFNIPVGPINRWDSLAYEALIDRDNTTVVFVKGLNLRPERASNASRFECVYGWDFRKPKFLLRLQVVSIAQEIVRCKTPLSVLIGSPMINKPPIKVSIRAKGGGTLRTIARPVHRSDISSDPTTRKQYEMCVCTMLRNQAKFIKEWVMYHARIGVQRWFIYDNNSDDDTDRVIDTLSNYNITRHVWPWIKTQESGFAHCALRARDTCDWVGFIDVDEFFHLPTGLMLHDVIKNLSRRDDGNNVGELRVMCHSFGPSGLKHVPIQGVTVGYTCRMAAPERHKSIVRPEALNSTLINVVHHFHLRDGFEYVNVDQSMMVINHYKYQVWEVFKEKFFRRVATYVADWKDMQNSGSKDRAPGLGTRAVEPPDWSNRFCEVNDTGLRDRVLEDFTNIKTQLLPWQEVTSSFVDVQKMKWSKRKNLSSGVENKRRSRRKRRHRILL